LANNLADFVFFFTFSDWANFFCRPAVDDLLISADDTNAEENINTNYYTIYGDWNPSLASNCQPVYSHVIDWLKLEKQGYSSLEEPNYGVVPASSVEALPNYIHHTSLGPTHDCHTNLLSKPEFDLAKKVLY
jgi:hypothetical protein